MVAIFANNATGKLGGDVTTSSTTLILQTGNGALFPSPTAGDYFPITVVKADGTLEIMKCTARSVDTLTVTRSQEGTTAKAFTIGDRVSLRMTAGSLVDFVSNKQPLDATLTALAGVATAADKLIYATGADTFATTTLTAFIRTVLDDATASDVLTTLGMSTFIKSLIDDMDAATARATLGAQASDATLTALAGVTTAADKIIYATAADTFTTTTLTAFARTLLDNTTASAVLATLGVSAFVQGMLGNLDAATVRATIGAISESGNAASASKLYTACTIALSGDVTGSVSFDGSANATINADMTDASVMAIAAAVAAGDIGSVAILQYTVAQASLIFGQTYAGSSLKPWALTSMGNVVATTPARSGTWRCLSSQIASTPGYYPIGLFLRIS